MPLYTCTICGRITTEAQCPDHRPARPSRHWSRNRDSRAQARFRTLVLQRANGHCERCGATDKPLTAAHWPVPLRAFEAGDPDAYDPASGKAFCEQCDKLLDPYARHQ
jgi:hypothetical protein